MFQIEGRDQLWEWLAAERDPDRRQGMLDWLAGFAAAPLDEAYDARRVPGVRAPVFIVRIPLLPTSVLMRFLYVDQYRVIKIIDFGRLP